MPNLDNLKGHEFTSDQSREKAAENGRKGGIASGKAKRRRKAFAEAFEVLLQREASNGVQGIDAIAAKVFKQSLEGDMKAVQFIRDTVGEMPVQRVEVDTIDPQARAEMDELLGLS